MIASRLTRLGSAVVLAAAMAACADQPTSVRTPTVFRPGLASKAPSLAVTGGPDLSDFRNFQGEVWICKDGNQTGENFSFDYSVIRVSDGALVTSGTTVVPVGQCRLATNISTQVNGRYRATATETTVLPYWSLTAIDWAYAANIPNTPPPPVVDLANRTISAVLLTNDFGVQLTFTNTYTPPTGKIGDFVWNDVNGNGVQDSGENGIAGVQMTLSGPVSGTATTDANGYYLFSGLPAGSYTVTAATPAGYVASPSGQGGDPAKDSNGSPATVTLATDNSEDLTIDFGYTQYLGKIGDFVWYDVNGNGVQDTGENGIAGVQMTLSGPVGGTATTDANGYYEFAGLPAGSYTVTAATPAGYVASPSGQGGDPSKDSNGSPASVTLATNTSQDLTIDFGYTKYLGAIGDFVWEDLNNNGLQDVNEPGIQGITVTLGGAASATATTDQFGFYSFTGLAAGSYTVTVGAGPSNYTPALANQGSNDAIDSDGTAPVTVVLATNTAKDYTLDFGFVPPLLTGCSRTIGYWKTHAGFTGRNPDMVTQYLPIWLGNAGGVRSVQVTTATQAVSFLSMSGGASNGIVKLQAQLLAAKLNLKAGANGSAITATITTADAFLAANAASAWSSLSNSQRAQVNGWMTTLDNYNNGLIGPGHCP